MSEEKPPKPARKRSPVKKRPEPSVPPTPRAAEPSSPPAPPRKRATAPRRAAARKTTTAAAPSVIPSPVIDVSPPLSVLMVASEAHPFAKTGGLAEVSASLSDALGQLGHAVTLVLPRYRVVTSKAPSAYRRGFDSATALQPVDLARATPVGSGHARARRRAGALRSRGALRHRRRRLSDNACDSRCSAARRSSIRACASSGRRSSTRTTGRRASCPSTRRCICRATRSSAACPPSSRSTTSRSRACFRPRRCPAIGLGWEVLDVQGAGVLGQHQLSEGRHQLQREDHDGQPELRAARSSRRSSASASKACSRGASDDLRRHPQRHRHRPMESGERSRSCRRSFSADDLAGKRDAKRALLDVVGLPADDDGAGAAARRPGVAADGSERVRPDRRRRRRADGARRDLGHARQRRAALRGAVARARRRDIPTACRRTIGFDERLAHLIEAGADMFLMPSRFEPCGLNQMYSLRYGTVPIVRATGGLERHRRRCRPKPAAALASSSATTPPGAARRRGPAGAARLSQTPRGWKEIAAGGACGRTIPGTLRPGSMSKCIEQCVGG